MQATRVILSPSSAAAASACGPPPEPPITANRSKLRASAIAPISATQSAIRRPRWRSTSVARTIVDDDVGAGGTHQFLVWPTAKSTAWGPVTLDDWIAVKVAPLGKHQNPAVRSQSRLSAPVPSYWHIIIHVGCTLLC